MAEAAVAQIELQAVHDIALAIKSAEDLSTVLQRVAEAIAGRRANRDAYVYIYDVETNELVLAGATESPAARQVGTLRVAYGDGVTGWVAASRQSYLIPEEPSRDPHFLAYPGIGEEEYGAIFSVPIMSRNDDLLGCITVWATNGHRFDPSEVPFVERVGALIAGTFEARLLLDTTRHLAHVSAGTAELAAMVAAGGPVARTLEFATELALDTTHSEIVIALVADPGGADRMHFKAVASPGDHASRVLVERVRHELLAIDQDIRHGRMNWRAAEEEVTHVLKEIAQAVTSAVVRVGPDELGMLGCYRLTSARFSTDDAASVATIANHAAVALKLAMLSAELTGRNGLNWFLRDLSSGRASPEELRRRASALGLDNAGGYVFVAGSIAAQPVPGVDVSATSLGRGLEELLAEVREIPRNTRYVSTSHQTVAIVPWTGDADSIETLRLPLLSVCARLRTATGTALTFGVSRPASAVDDFPGALAEAREALAIGSGLPTPHGVFTLDDVGHHLLLSRVSGAGSVRDRYATAVARIAEYDRAKGTELLDTLAAFLHYRSRTAASRELFVHRNTLNQRLTRASRLSGFDILASSEWFPLQLALKVHQAKTGVATAQLDRERPASAGNLQ
ncbi:MAG: GAF domain-containing protein [Mycobacterium sp.]|nr:GAF domain-containing protein [Mycobacterium sp.]